MFYNRFFGNTVGRLIPGPFFDRPRLERLSHQLTYLISAQGNERPFVVFVELGTKIQRVYARVVSIDDEELLRLSEQPALLYELSLLRGQRNSSPPAMGAYDGGRFQQHQPIPCPGVVGVDRNEASTRLFLKDAHKPKPTNSACLVNLLLAGNLVYR
jgi:hypothetical protein